MKQNGIARLIRLFLCFFTPLCKGDPALPEQISSIESIELKAIGNMLDGGSKCWRFEYKDKKPIWVISKTGVLNPGPPWEVIICLSKGSNGEFTQCIPVPSKSMLEKKLLDLINSEIDRTDVLSEAGKKKRIRLDILANFIKERSSPMTVFKLLHTNNRLEETYPE